MYKESNYPEFCFNVNNVTDEVILIKRGEVGYYPYRSGTVKGKSAADDLNIDLGITKDKSEAMLVGSMFGWDVPGADPAMYDDNGKPHHRERPRHPRQGKPRGY